MSLSSRHCLLTPRWKRLRAVVRRRDGYKCVKCGRRGRLECDHILPRRTHPKLVFDPSNVQTLCRPCHFDKSRREEAERRESIRPKVSNILWNQAVSELMG